jgi:hypothetical protein
MINEFLKSLNLGKPFYEGNVLFVPVKGKGGNGHFSLLNESMKSGKVKISEVGNVDTVSLNYSGNSPLFVMDGEEIIGARQNRVFNTSFITERVEEIPVPVSCVEEGRYQGKKNFIPSEVIAYPELRSIIASSTTRSLEITHSFKADQASIWESVKKTLNTLKKTSKTLSMHDGYENKKETLFSEFKPDRDTIGLIAYTGKKPLGVDIFGSHYLFKKLSTRIILSYLFGAYGIRGKFSKPDGFFNKLKEIKEWKSFEGVGKGKELRYIGNKIVAKASIFKDKPAHISMFLM